ncbi:hypothetical protein ZWY2020_035525 [Hordeum vulgare]|nr:hypothetical protein ZWY2020_035525 [Hordeum vulgare]
MAVFSLAALLLLLPPSGMATPAAAEDDVQHYTHGIGMWVCTVYARPGPIDKATCDWMCRLSNNSTDGGLQQVRLGDYDCCDMGCRCSFCVSVYTIGAGHGMRAAAVWPIALSSLLVLVVTLA